MFSREELTQELTALPVNSLMHLSCLRHCPLGVRLGVGLLGYAAVFQGYNSLKDSPS